MVSPLRALIFWVPWNTPIGMAETPAVCTTLPCALVNMRLARPCRGNNIHDERISRRTWWMNSDSFSLLPLPTLARQRRCPSSRASTSTKFVNTPTKPSILQQVNDMLNQRKMDPLLLLCFMFRLSFVRLSSSSFTGAVSSVTDKHQSRPVCKPPLFVFS